jgi:hypothetical protein
VYGPLKCLLVQVDQLCPDANCVPLENNGWKCDDEHGMSHFLVGLPTDFFLNDELRSGRSELYVSLATKRRGQSRNEIIVDPNATVKVVSLANQSNGNGGGGMLRGIDPLSENRLEGQLTILVVYVTSLDSSPSDDFATVVNDILGTNGDTVNLVSSSVPRNALGQPWLEPTSH